MPLLLPVAGVFAGSPATNRAQVDVCVYGGTSGGVIAAAALAKLGRSVLLVEPTRHLGGMTSGGLGRIDYKYAEWIVGGLAGEWIRQMKAVYARQGIDTRKFGNAGWVVEPHVAEELFDRLAANDRIQVVREARLASVARQGKRIMSLTLDKAPPDARGAPAPRAAEPEFITVHAGMFIDCSYEGDLLAAAGVTTRSDREGQAEYNESAAGLRWNSKTEFGRTVPSLDPYIRPGDPSSGLLPLVSDGKLGPPGSASPVLQAYNFRLCLTKNNPIPIAPPADYEAGRYEILARLLAALKVAGTPITPADFHHGPERLLKMSPLPKGKIDLNNAGVISMDYVSDASTLYAGASWAERAKLWHAHEDYQRGFLHFLATDPRVDDAVRAEVRRWGLARDEFQDTGGWPFQLYVREARRMVGQYVMRQSDCEKPPKTLPDSVGLGVYSLDSHLCQRVAVDGHIVHEGGFLLRIPGPYPIPYRALMPKAAECENILATFCVSATHVSFASLRMEPQFMVLSESAARAAHQALEENKPVQEINVGRLRKSLLDAGQVLDPASHQK